MLRVSRCSVPSTRLLPTVGKVSNRIAPTCLVAALMTAGESRSPRTLCEDAAQNLGPGDSSGVREALTLAGWPFAHLHNLVLARVDASKNVLSSCRPTPPHALASAGNPGGRTPLRTDFERILRLRPWAAASGRAGALPCPVAPLLQSYLDTHQAVCAQSLAPLPKVLMFQPAAEGIWRMSTPVPFHLRRERLPFSSRSVHCGLNSPWWSKGYRS